MFKYERDSSITTVLFDMDGTISDSFPGISNGICQLSQQSVLLAFHFIRFFDPRNI